MIISAVLFVVVGLIGAQAVRDAIPKPDDKQPWNFMSRLFPELNHKVTTTLSVTVLIGVGFFAMTLLFGLFGWEALSDFNLNLTSAVVGTAIMFVLLNDRTNLAWVALVVGIMLALLTHVTSGTTQNILNNLSTDVIAAFVTAVLINTGQVVLTNAEIFNKLTGRQPSPSEKRYEVKMRFKDDAKNPLKQSDYVFRYVNRYHIGTIATFVAGTYQTDKTPNRDHTNTLKRLTEKLARLSVSPRVPLRSYMGDRVPGMEHPDNADKKRTWRAHVSDWFDNVRQLKRLEPTTMKQLEFDEQEQALFDRVFCIFGISGEDHEFKPKYAFLNVRADRVGPLFEAFNSGKTFDLSELSTVIAVGDGAPTFGDLREIYKKFLFSGQPNVRIFPTTELAGVETDKDIASAYQLFVTGQYDKAYEAYKTLAANRFIAPVNRLIFMGNSAHMTGQLKNAEAAYDEAVRLNPYSGSPRFWRALLYIEQKRTEDALEEFIQFDTLTFSRTDEISFGVWRGIIAKLRGQNALCDEYLTLAEVRIKNLGDSKEWAERTRALIDSVGGSKEQAIAHYAHCLDTYPKAWQSFAPRLYVRVLARAFNTPMFAEIEQWYEAEWRKRAGQPQNNPQNDYSKAFSNYLNDLIKK
jgi:tetratricopeptide (TPR) repeat protein